MEIATSLQINDMQVFTSGDYINLYQDHRRFCEASIKIRDFSGTTVNFKELSGPAKLNAAFDCVDRSGEPGRIIVLKSRRAGMSSGIGAQFWRRTAFVPGRSCSIVAHTKDAASEIASLYEQYEDSYDDAYEKRVQLDLPLVKKLRRTARNRQSIRYERGSSIKVITGGNKQAARSFSSHCLHLSELPFIKDAATFLTGALQTAPRRPGCFVVIESTPNGVGDPFYVLWQAAAAGQNEFIPVFFAWFEDPVNTKQLADSEVERFANSLTAKEREMQQLHSLTLDQLNWRRWKIRNDCFGSEEVFRQEYPTTAEDCFLTTGRAFFDMVVLGRQPILPPVERGRMQWLEDGMERRLAFVPHQAGEVTIWERPKPGAFYLAGLDVAQGQDAAGLSTGRRDADYGHLPIFELESGVQVAEWCARATPNETARQAYALLRWYNWAFVTPEANSIGISVIEGLVEAGYPLDRMHRRMRSPDDLGSPALNELGYWQSGGREGSRWHMLRVLESLLLTGRLQLRSQATRAEFYTFLINPMGKPEAAQGCHDDRVFGVGLAAVGLDQAEMVKTVAQRAAPSTMRPIRYNTTGLGRDERDW